MFLPFKLRNMTLENRVVVSPMAMYSAEDGVPNDFHLVHLGARAVGGAGLVFTEMTCVSAEGRISPGCCGLWNEAQQEAYARIVRFVHAQSRAKIALQLGHSGPKGATRVGWEGYDVPLDADGAPIVGEIRRRIIGLHGRTPLDVPFLVSCQWPVGTTASVRSEQLARIGSANPESIVSQV